MRRWGDTLFQRPAESDTRALMAAACELEAVDDRVTRTTPDPIERYDRSSARRAPGRSAPRGAGRRDAVKALAETGGGYNSSMARTAALPADLERRLNTLGQTLAHHPAIVFAYLFGERRPSTALAGRILASRRVLVDREPFLRHRYESVALRKFFDFRVLEHRLLARRVPSG